MFGERKEQPSVFSNRKEQQREVEALIDPKTPLEVYKAYTSPYSPLFQKVIAYINECAEIKAIRFEIIVDFLQEIAAEKAKYSQMIVDQIAAQELVDARRQMQESQAANQTKPPVEIPTDVNELSQACANFAALVDALKNNVKTVKKEITRINHEIETITVAWCEAQEAKAKQSIDEMIKTHGATVELNVKTSTHSEKVVIDLEAKRELLAQAYVVPSPARFLVFNPKLQGLVKDSPALAGAFLAIAQEARVKHVLGDGKPSVIKACVHLGLGKSNMDEKDIEKAISTNTCLEAKNARDSVLERLKSEGGRAAVKFNELAQQLLSHPDVPPRNRSLGG